MEKLIQQWQVFCQDLYAFLAPNLPLDGLLCFVAHPNSNTHQYAHTGISSGSPTDYVAYAYQFDPVHYSQLAPQGAQIAFLNQYPVNETYQCFLNQFNVRDSAEIITPHQDYQFGISLVRENHHHPFQNSELPYLHAMQKLCTHYIQKLDLQTNHDHASDYHLTKKETTIMHMLCLGLSNQEIADQSFCSITTVKTHVSHILHKTTCKNRQQLLRKFYPTATAASH